MNPENNGEVGEIMENKRLWGNYIAGFDALFLPNTPDKREALLGDAGEAGDRLFGAQNLPEEEKYKLTLEEAQMIKQRLGDQFGTMYGTFKDGMETFGFVATYPAEKEALQKKMAEAKIQLFGENASKVIVFR
jgi:hypothetical protein